ncbi:MAG: histone deacetylase [Methanoregulaceae archaeon]|nr:histone deacetylase [Methanoregulaceae archaeon]
MQHCTAIFGEVFAKHEMDLHTESAARIRIARAGVPAGVEIVMPEPATEADLERVHLPSYIRMIRELSSYGGIRYIDPNTYVTADSFDVASHAAGAGIQAAGLALSGVPSFALGRPPGHHAEPDQAMGFCLFNNAAVAAAWALTRVRRVAIIDWDLHHGNGTQKIFYGTDRVLYCSIHKVNSFPRTGWVDEIGTGPGRGFNVNAPIREGGSISDYRRVFEEVFSDVIGRFEPDLVIVSAGQDPLSDDPIGGMLLTPGDFALLTSIILDSARSPLALVLEGGYGPSLGLAVTSIFHALTGEMPDRRDLEPGKARESTERIISELRAILI